MNRLHPVVEQLAALRQHRQLEADVERAAVEKLDRLRTAQAAHQAAVAAHRAELDAGTAGAPPVWNPPADAAAIAEERRRLADAGRDVLAAVASEAEAALRVRADELLAQAAVLVEQQLEPIRAELEQVIDSTRAVVAARGRPSRFTTLPGGITLAELVDHAAAGVPVIPVDLAQPAPHDPGARAERAEAAATVTRAGVLAEAAARRGEMTSSIRDR